MVLGRVLAHRFRMVGAYRLAPLYLTLVPWWKFVYPSQFSVLETGVCDERAATANPG